MFVYTKKESYLDKSSIIARKDEIAEQERFRNAKEIQIDETYFTKSIKASPKFCFQHIVEYCLFNTFVFYFALILKLPDLLSRF